MIFNAFYEPPLESKILNRPLTQIKRMIQMGLMAAMAAWLRSTGNLLKKSG
jgi:hypothetical protein